MAVRAPVRRWSPVVPALGGAAVILAALASSAAAVPPNGAPVHISGRGNQCEPALDTPPCIIEVRVGLLPNGKSEGWFTYDYGAYRPDQVQPPQGGDGLWCISGPFVRGRATFPFSARFTLFIRDSGDGVSSFDQVIRSGAPNELVDASCTALRPQAASTSLFTITAGDYAFR